MNPNPISEVDKIEAEIRKLEKEVKKLRAQVRITQESIKLLAGFMNTHTHDDNDQ